MTANEPTTSFKTWLLWPPPSPSPFEFQVTLLGVRMNIFWNHRIPATWIPKFLNNVEFVSQNCRVLDSQSQKIWQMLNSGGRRVQVFAPPPPALSTKISLCEISRPWEPYFCYCTRGKFFRGSGLKELKDVHSQWRVWAEFQTSPWDVHSWKAAEILASYRWV